MSLRSKIRSLIILNHMVVVIGISFFPSSGYLWLTLIGVLLIVKLGGELGYHRYFAHKAFESSGLGEIILLSLGVLNAFGSPLAWSAIHRAHHQKSDSVEDPHGKSFVKTWLTLWPMVPLDSKLSLDLMRNKRVRFIHKHYFKIVLGTYLITFLMDPKWFIYGLNGRTFY